MTATISRLYDDYAAASQAVSELERAGVPHGDISIVASNADNWYSGDRDKGGRNITGRVDRDHDGTDDRAEGAAAGAGIGAGVGGTVGLLAGLGLLAIPGIGPVVAAGWLVATAAGAAAGGATGGLIGALTQGLRRGGTLVTVRVPDADRARVEAILDRSAVNVRDRGTAYRKSGWKGFDPKAPAYTADQVRKERQLHRSAA
jgi:hypothetical protein